MEVNCQVLKSWDDCNINPSLAAKPVYFLLFHLPAKCPPPACLGLFFQQIQQHVLRAWCALFLCIWLQRQMECVAHLTRVLQLGMVTDINMHHQVHILN